MKLFDIQVLAALLDVTSFTEAAQKLGLPKQHVSRKVKEAEEELGVLLVSRTTRAFRLTEAGQRVAERCAEVTRLAAEIGEEISSKETLVRGTLRVTADPLFGETFLPAVIESYLGAHKEVSVDLMLTSRQVDLIEEGFDVAFRVGTLLDSSFLTNRLCAARLLYVASPAYLATRPPPTSPKDLGGHSLIALAPEGKPARWAFAAPEGVSWVRITPRLQVNSLAMAKRAALLGLGIANLPEFSCANEIAQGSLVPVLYEHRADFGSISIVYPSWPSRRLLPQRVRAFVSLALELLQKCPELRD